MAFENPFSVLFDSEGVELAVTASFSGSFEDGTQSGLLLMGSSSAGAQFLSVGTDGQMTVTVGNQPTVDQGSQGTIGNSWYVSITDGTSVIGTEANPFAVSGSVAINGSVTIDDTTPIDVNITGEPVEVTGSVFADIIGATFDANGNLVVAVSGANVDNGALQITGSVVLGEQPILVSGAVDTTPTKCPNSTVTGVIASTTNFTVLPANGNRCVATFYMDGNATAYIKLGATATTTDYTVKVGNAGYYEVPGNYTGQVDVIFDKNGNATLRTTEIAE